MMRATELEAHTEMTFVDQIEGGRWWFRIDIMEKVAHAYEYLMIA